MDAVAEKELYESMDSVKLVVGTDEFAEVLLALTGTVVMPAGSVRFSGAVRESARRVAYRWLKQNGYVPSGPAATNPWR